MVKADLSEVVCCRNKIFAAAIRDSNPKLKSFAVNLTRKIHSGEILSVNELFNDVPKEIVDDLVSITTVLV